MVARASFKARITLTASIGNNHRRGAAAHWARANPVSYA